MYMVQFIINYLLYFSLVFEISDTSLKTLFLYVPTTGTDVPAGRSHSFLHVLFFS